MNMKKAMPAGRQGFATILSTLLILTVCMVIILSAGYVSLNNLKATRNNIYSAQAYYTAESGAEDSVLRLSKGKEFFSSNNLTVGNGNATIEISNPIGGSRTIVVSGYRNDRIRKIRVVYSINADGIAFRYGAQAGDGGIEMRNNARIKGNVFSNGSVIANIKGYIDNSVIVAHNGNKIKGLVVGGDALVHTCESSTISGTLTYVSGGSSGNCTAEKEIKNQPNEVSPVDLPISVVQINDWKNDALAGGIFNNNYSLTNGATGSLGPIQIGTPGAPKNLTISNGAHLKITGTVYVTGSINIMNNVIIELDNNIYGSMSGIILADGRITISNGGILRGSGLAGSYMLVMSTNNSLDPASPAISVSNNAQGAIFYTNTGLILLSNNMKAKEVTGYKLNLYNNAEIEYESGLENALFSSGPGGAGEITSWEEIE